MLDVIAPLVVSNTTKIVLVSLDGLGGLPRPETGRSELETARLPNLSQLASEAACGLIRHVAPGITPGSGPGHLGLFGYDPLHYQVGRGVLEGLGIELDLRARARGGARLAAGLTESDPQVLGTPPLPVKALNPRAKATAALVNRFVAEARRLLADALPANMVLLRGFDQLPKLPRFPEVFGLRSAAIAAYPMYRGLAKLVGMEILKTG